MAAVGDKCKWMAFGHNREFTMVYRNVMGAPCDQWECYELSSTIYLTDYVTVAYASLGEQTGDGCDIPMALADLGTEVGVEIDRMQSLWDKPKSGG